MKNHEITNMGAVLIMQTAYKCALACIARARRVSDNQAAKKFDRMTAEIMREKSTFDTLTNGGEITSPTTETIDGGDGLQVVYTAYQTLCELALTDPEYADKIPFSVWAYQRGRRFVDNRFSRAVNGTIHSKRIENIAPFQIAYRECSRYIQEHSSPDTRRQKVTYLEDIAQYDIDGTMYRELVYHECRFMQNADGENAETLTENRAIASFLDYFKSELTETQRAVLEYRAKGYGYKYIATKRHVTQRAIAKTCAQIAAKFLAFVKSDTDMYARYIGMIIFDDTADETHAEIIENAPIITPAENAYTRREWNYASAFDDYF